MLAYVFWHAPAPGTERRAYEARLAAFHAALRAEPPAGFAGSVAAAIDASPVPGGAHRYEDWYLVADWTALGALNAAAVEGARRGPHDAAAALAADGAAGVYAPLRGDAVPPSRPHAAWLVKPAGLAYEAFLAGLGDGHDAVWQRQMTLGPAPEFCVLGDALPRLPYPAAAIGRRPVAGAYA